jgi:hypothetical protein
MPLLSDERRVAAVHYAARNERINTNEDSYDSPDMGTTAFTLMEVWFLIIAASTFRGVISIIVGTSTPFF